MTKRVLHKQVVSACAWLLISVNAYGFDLKWSSTFSRDQQAAGRAALASLASRWQTLSFETLPAELLTIESLAPQPSLHHGARSQQGRILVSSLLSKDEFPSVIAHELAHQVWFSHCGPTNPQDEIIHEAFALWISEDMHRQLLRDHEISYLSQAREVLFQQKGRALDPQPRAVQVALARLMSIPDTRATWADFFKKLVPQCRSTETLRDSFWALVAQADYSPRAGRLHFLLQDGLSGEELSSHGPVEKAYPVGSILKPLAVQLLPSLQTPATSRDDVTWFCPSLQVRPRPWTWQEALVKSCNGFFLDHVISKNEWQNWRGFWSRLGRPEVAPAMAEVVGLNPNLTLNLREVLRVYHWLDLTSPTIVDALRKTPSMGTVAGSPTADWFVRNQIALKTGSVRSASGEPIQSWIVALGPRAEGGVSSFRAVIFSEGRATAELLPELRTLLAKRWRQKSGLAQVQILGLVPLEKLRYSCPDQAPTLTRKPGGQWKLLQNGSEPAMLSANQEFQCLGSPLRLHFPGHPKGEELSRLYFGRLQVESESTFPTLATNELKPAAELPADSRQRRARRGSAVTLLTSEGHYAEQVLASEFPRGHQETLTALALGVLHNHAHSPHPGRPICDTTHCQVFAYQENLPQHLRSRIRNAVETALLQRRQKSLQEPWFYFSLGGSKPWTKSLSRDRLKQQLAMQGEVATIARRPTGQLEVLSTTGEQRLFDCETFRNQLRLLSCPENMTRQGRDWSFSGKGEGHGRGLNLIETDLKALAGAKYESLLNAK